ncbi:DUF6255 family natural product biosynthesis protein [Streptomyces huiliensis]|uniref:DUF6255 family natural product biosynthesis protein n=1 Tax=Streptomyces huiliensis TaxID=2876027 RepID=UPI001CBF068D|nr:hypothetical protein [Streptomyces huiliensis]
MTPAANCRHPAAGWTESGHVIVCSACGVRRFPDYAALWWPAREYRAASPTPSTPSRRTHHSNPTRICLEQELG